MRGKQVTYAGFSGNIRQWAARLGMRPGTIAARLRRGWPLHYALSLGVFSRKQIRMFK